jgi:Tfp pilus assembly protein PilE
MNTRAVSLAELVIALVILGVLAAMAIPNFSSAATHSPETQLRAQLIRLRTAIDLYYDHHQAYPGQCAAGTPDSAAGTPAAMILQLTQFSAADGRTSPTHSEVFCYGPYLRDGIPHCPVVPAANSTAVHLVDSATHPVACDAAAGWIYNCQTGYVIANSAEPDSCGVGYDTY